jgi:hypothetical protein
LIAKHCSKIVQGQTKEEGWKRKAFALHHCWFFLEHDEKWRTRNDKVPIKSKKLSNCCSPIDDKHANFADEDSNGRSPIPSSVPPKKRSPGRKV